MNDFWGVFKEIFMASTMVKKQEPIRLKAVRTTIEELFYETNPYINNTNKTIIKNYVYSNVKRVIA